MALGRFLRGLLPGSGSNAGGGPGGSSPVPGAGAAAGPAARPANAWRGLPPIQRTVAGAPLIAPTSAFRAALPTAQRAPTALAPLGHERGLSAPAGLVSGIAAPVQRESAPVPASVRPAGVAARATAASGTADVAGPAVWRLADTSVPESVVWPAFGSGGDEADVAMSARRMAPVVAPVAAGPSLTRAATPAGLPGGRVGSPPAVAREVATPSAAAPTPVAPAPSSGPAPTAAVPGHHAVPAAPPIVARTAEVPAPSSAVPARRLRIGAPIRPVSGGPTMQRTWDRDAGATRAAAPAPLPAPARPATPAAAPVVAREEAGHEGHTHGPAGEELDAAPAPAQREAEIVPLRPLAVARSVDAPLVGTLQPMISSASPAVAVRVQAEQDDEAQDGPEAGSPEAALAALGRMDAGAGIAGPFASAPNAAPGVDRPSLFPSATAGPFGRPGAGPAPAAPATPSVSRSVASAPAVTPLPSPAARPSAAPLGRTITRGAPPPQAPAVPGLPVGAGMSWDPMHGMTGPGVQRESGAGQAASPTAGSALSSTAFGGSAVLPPRPSLAPMVARESTDTPALPIQREEAAGGDAGGGAGTGGGATGGAAMAEAELDALARRLHDKIAAQLSRDLLVERERAGNLIDRGW